MNSAVAALIGLVLAIVLIIKKLQPVYSLMIGAQAFYEYQAGNLADMSLNAYATKSILGESI